MKGGKTYRKYEEAVGSLEFWCLKVEAGSDKRRGLNDRWEPLVRARDSAFRC